MSLPEPDVGRRLAAARLQRKLSQGTVGRRAGIASSYISRIENGKVHPTFRTVQRIARAMRVPFDEITGPQSRSRRGVCPVTSGGMCLLDLIRADTAASPREEVFTPRQIRMLRGFAVWLRGVGSDRQRAMEILLEDLTRGTRTGTKAIDA